MGASRTHAGRRFRVASPRARGATFHLCLHLEGHIYSELVLFCDIAELVRRYREDLDWSALVDVTRRYRAESSVYTSSS